MRFDPLPATAAWRHRGLRDGFEVVFLGSDSGGYDFQGYVAAVEGKQPWAVRYWITVDRSWKTRSVRVRAYSPLGERKMILSRVHDNGLLVDGEPAAQLDDCLDVDLEASTLTNALPIRRLQLRPGELAEVPAAYIRMPNLSVERLEQRYRRLNGGGHGQRYAYSAPKFAYCGELTYDTCGLPLVYPGLAERVV